MRLVLPPAARAPILAALLALAGASCARAPAVIDPGRLGSSRAPRADSVGSAREPDSVGSAREADSVGSAREADSVGSAHGADSVGSAHGAAPVGSVYEADSVGAAASDSMSLGMARAAAPGDTLARGPESAPPRAADSLAALRSASRGVDYVWVLRGALIQPASIDSLVERARRMGLRGLLVQVVGRGDAYYASSLLPRAEALGPGSDADPLAHLLSRAHAAGLEVHAWMNCMLVWSSTRPPRDPRHVLRAHPEWVAALPDGRRMSRLSPRALRRLHAEGVYLASAHPGVRRWVASIAAEIASRYEVDGIHLDYIRQPDAEVGYDPTTRARFALAAGVDPARMSMVARARRPWVQGAWRDFRRDQVTAVVRAVRDTLQATRPGLALSAAVVADTTRAEGATGQAWRAWMRDGLVDRAYVMCYSPEVQRVLDELVVFGGELGTSGRIVPGIAVYNTSPATAAVKLRGARALGFPVLALYSYDSLFTLDGGWSRLEQGLEDPPDDEGSLGGR